MSSGDAPKRRRTAVQIREVCARKNVSIVPKAGSNPKHYVCNYCGGPFRDVSKLEAHFVPGTCRPRLLAGGDAHQQPSARAVRQDNAADFDGLPVAEEAGAIDNMDVDQPAGSGGPVVPLRHPSPPQHVPPPVPDEPLVGDLLPVGDPEFPQVPVC